MDISVALPLDPFLALLPLASKKDIRVYLNGIKVEIHPDGATYFVATDGHALGVLRHDLCSTAPKTDDGAPIEFIVPREFIEKLSVSKSMPELTFTVKDEKLGSSDWHNITMIDGATTHQQSILKYTFPRWRVVMPSAQNSGEAVQIDPELLYRFTKVAKLLGRKAPGQCIRVWHNGNAGARVTIVGAENFVGIIMPLRWNKDDAPGLSDERMKLNWTAPEKAPEEEVPA